MSTYEELSRLLAGELPDAEAEALQARIDADPELAAVWEMMQGLPAELAALPAEAPPPALDPDALGHVPDLQPALGRFSRRWGAAIAVAASLFLLWSTTRPGPPVMVSGMQVVEGHQTLYAGAVEVEVSGKAIIEVEPPPGLLREHGQEVEEMNRTHLLSALAGAVVTVTVLQGAAVLRADEAAPVVVETGQSHTVGAPAAPAPPAAATTAEPQRRVVVRTPGASPEAREAMLVEEIGRLRGELEQARVSAALSRGQLESLEGSPQEWPDDVPDVYRPAAFEAAVERALEEVPFGDLEIMDCNEYPCFAVIRSHDTGDDWQIPVDDFVGLLRDSAEGEDTGVMQHMSGFGRDGQEYRYAGLSFGPKDSQDDREVLDRTGYRVESAIKGLLEDALPAEGEADVEVD